MDQGGYLLQATCNLSHKNSSLYEENNIDGKINVTANSEVH